MKNLYNKIKDYIKYLGIEGIFSIIIGIILLIMGKIFLSGVFFGVFIEKNFILLKNYIKKILNI